MSGITEEQSEAQTGPKSSEAEELSEAIDKAAQREEDCPTAPARGSRPLGDTSYGSTHIDLARDTTTTKGANAATTAHATEEASALKPGGAARIVARGKKLKSAAPVDYNKKMLKTIAKMEAELTMGALSSTTKYALKCKIAKLISIEKRENLTQERYEQMCPS